MMHLARELGGVGVVRHPVARAGLTWHAGLALAASCHEVFLRL
jgi:hypothetical protein